MFIYILCAGFNYENADNVGVATDEESLTPRITALLNREIPFEQMYVERWVVGANHPEAVKFLVDDFGTPYPEPDWYSGAFCTCRG